MEPVAVAIANDRIEKVLASPDVHFFAKKVIREALLYDPVDAVHDLRLAFDVIRQHTDALLTQ